MVLEKQPTYRQAELRMIGKITTILAKKEAETYCSHGLHHEALDLYHNLLVHSPNLDPSIKAAIENQIGEISEKLETSSEKEPRRLSAADIHRVRRGWGKKATEADLMVCAQAFHQIGCYKDAAKELALMLHRGCAIDKAVRLMADCLARLIAPEQLIKSVGRLNLKIYEHPEKRTEFELALTREMADLEYMPHAMALHDHLQKKTDLSEAEARRFESISKKIQQLRANRNSRDSGTKMT